MGRPRAESSKPEDRVPLLRTPGAGDGASLALDMSRSAVFSLQISDLDLAILGFCRIGWIAEGQEDVLEQDNQLQQEQVRGPKAKVQAIYFEGSLDYCAEQIRAIHLHERVDPVNALDFRGLYSDFRPEQVLDRQDTNEEECLLAAIEEVADEEHARFSEFSSSHKAFKELIKKVKSWKKKCRLIPVLTERLVAAIWLCSHMADYEEVIPGLGENDSVTDHRL
ncbi:hypothetical protein TRIUR3_17897 [Triticum urartu]|uniref:Uncharacterized protein n=1 Tax=Triticum urartu TaxID=4572 RepID=M8A130_TRIUA|nr:hypothetical protein TRIUR3_17897 [Triticum urartu]